MKKEKRISVIDRCLERHPDAFVWSKVDEGTRHYYVVTRKGIGHGLLSHGNSPKAAWRNLWNILKRTPEITIMNRDECDKKGTLRDFFNKCKDYAEIRFSKEGLLVINWSEKGRGFGQYSFFKDKGKWVLDNECDGREAVKRVMCRLIDSLPLVDPIEGEPP